MKIGKISIYLVTVVIFLCACKEETRYSPKGAGKTPPGVPTDITWKPLYGGARFHYTIPRDEDLMSVNAEYTNEKGKTYYFSSSFYKDSVDIYGLGEEKEYTIYLYGVNRTGNQSNKVPVKIVPLEPSITRVANTLDIKPAFSSFFLDWENELEQVINVFVKFKYNENGTPRELISVLSSNKEKERFFIRDINASDAVNVTAWVEDRYENSSPTIDFGNIYLLEDYPLDKSIIKIPEANDSTVILRNGTRFNTGVPAMFGENLEGRMSKLIDGIIDRGDNLNFFHTGSRGRTGNSRDGNMPWNVIFDLGDYYQLSRINSVQRHTGGLENISRGQYYRYENCGHFKLYYFDEDNLKWEECSEQKTPIPVGISELQFVLLGEAGDEAFFFPDDPKYTKTTRWFRYEGLHCFDDNYSSEGANCMSELTVYGKKAN